MEQQQLAGGAASAGIIPSSKNSLAQLFDSFPSLSPAPSTFSRVIIHSCSKNLQFRVPGEQAPKNYFTMENVGKATTVLEMKTRVAAFMLGLPEQDPRTLALVRPGQSQLTLIYVGKRMDDRRALGDYVAKDFGENMRITLIYDPTGKQNSYNWIQGCGGW